MVCCTVMPFGRRRNVTHSAVRQRRRYAGYGRRARPDRRRTRALVHQRHPIAVAIRGGTLGGCAVIRRRKTARDADSAPQEGRAAVHVARGFN